MAPRFLVILLALACAGPGEARAGEARVLPASYPEGPLWQGDRLYFAEMGADRIRVLEGEHVRTFFEQAGCGPTAIAPYGDGYLVLCHIGGRVVAVNAGGREVRRWDRDESGNPLMDPNDSSADGDGGVWFSDPGRFARRRTPQGWVMHLSANGVLRRVAGPLSYPNGVHVAGDVLYVSEHLGNRVLRYDIEAAGRLGEACTLVSPTQLRGPARHRPAYELTGPDGLEIGPDGNLYVTIYGEGRLLKFSPEGELLGMTELPTRYLTNVAFGKPGMAVTGSFDNRKPPFPGEVRILPARP
ncbi:MAG: SMP-30/gluconolactonase/LRE family protein [Gammaproteobacteria bacterium]